jgi:hypothetical protein
MGELQHIQAQWVRLGALFHVRKADTTPDVEALLIKTARVAGQSARLLAMSISWLVRYEKLVCRHRLAAILREVKERETLATMGYMLSAVKRETGGDHFNRAIGACKPSPRPLVLFDAYRMTQGLRKVAKAQSDPLAIQWGLYAPRERDYDDAIRPTAWTMEQNPGLYHRAVFGGQLTASVLAALEADPQAGRSESALAKRLGATRVALRDAVNHLELCQLVTRQRNGASMRIAPCIKKPRQRKNRLAKA